MGISDTRIGDKTLDLVPCRGFIIAPLGVVNARDKMCIM